MIGRNLPLAVVMCVAHETLRPPLGSGDRISGQPLWDRTTTHNRQADFGGLASMFSVARLF